MRFFKKLRRLRELEARIAFARLQLSEDHRWMAGSAIVERLTTRYSLMLSDGWRSVPFPDSCKLRRSLDLDPHTKPARMPGYASMLKLEEFRDLLLEHAVNHEDDTKWDEAAWHDRVVAALADYLVIEDALDQKKQ